MLWAVALLLVFLLAGSQTSSGLEGGMISISRKRGSYIVITCDIHEEGNYIHWYLFRVGQAPHRLLYYDFFASKPVVDSEFSPGKYHAYEGTKKSYKFVLRNVEESDSGVYYCAIWASAKKIFGGGTKLIVTDKSFNNAISPKPTVFLPSVAETNLHKTGTYLCLLENFFPDVIKVYWKRTDDNRILEAQQGDTMKTNDTYMKFSWLTVTGDSMTKKHKCIVKHEANGGVDQEILFDPVKEVVTIDSEVCFKHKTGLLHLQLTSTSAYYTYLLLLLKSALHGGLVVFCLLRGSPVCCEAKSA